MIPIDWIFDAGCAATVATPAEIRGRSRKGVIVHKRAFIARKMRDDGYSYPRIGRALGYRHHTTILWILGVTKQKKARKCRS